MKEWRGAERGGAGESSPRPEPGRSRGTETVRRAGLVVLAAAGLAPCALLYASTRRLGWALLLAAALPPALAAPALPSRRRGFGKRDTGIRVFLGLLYLAGGLWVALWALLPDLEGYVLNAVLSSAFMLVLLGALLLLFPMLLPTRGSYIAEESDQPDESGPPHGMKSGREEAASGGSGGGT